MYNTISNCTESMCVNASVLCVTSVPVPKNPVKKTVSFKSFICKPKSLASLEFIKEQSLPKTTKMLWYLSH